MNQILILTERQKEQKSRKVPKTLYKDKLLYFIPVLLLLLLIIFSRNVQVNGSEEKIEEDISEISQEEVSNNTIEEKVEDKVEENNTTTKVSSTYTTSNGKTYEIVGVLKIPSLDIEYPVLSSTSEELLKVSLNKYWGANPNEVGNCCIVGHNYENTKFFSKLPNIKIGDTVELTDLNRRKLIYTVYDTYVVEPEDTSCTSQLTNGKTEITLITCYNRIKRFVAKARAN